MFPFNLPGPSFLVFYACLAAFVLGAFWFYARSGGEPGETRITELTSDPYKVGFLRGSDEETVRLALFNLVDRGYLAHAGRQFVADRGEDTQLLRRPLDRAILAKTRALASFEQIVADPAVRAACAAYGQELAASGLVRDAGRQSAVFKAFLAVLGLLGGLAFARVLQALSHGRFNILFLVVLAIAACWIAFRVHANRRTFAGARKLRSLETLMNRLKARVKTLRSGGETNEALLLASVFGLAALPLEAFPFVDEIFPRPKPSDSSSGSWDSSSCGSSSGGSSCGGGGSGCGGCGGGD